MTFIRVSIFCFFGVQVHVMVESICTRWSCWAIIEKEVQVASACDLEESLSSRKERSLYQCPFSIPLNQQLWKWFDSLEHAHKKYFEIITKKIMLLVHCSGCWCWIPFLLFKPLNTLTVILSSRLLPF